MSYDSASFFIRQPLRILARLLVAMRRFVDARRIRAARRDAQLRQKLAPPGAGRREDQVWYCNNGRHGDAALLVDARSAASGHEAVGDARLRQVIGGKFTQNLIPHQNPDAVLPHLASRVAEHFVAILKFDPEHGIGKQFHHAPTHFQEFFLGHLCPLSAKLLYHRGALSPPGREREEQG
jgi:hypothetical protein